MFDKEKMMEIVAPDLKSFDVSALPRGATVCTLSSLCVCMCACHTHSSSRT